MYRVRPYVWYCLGLSLLVSFWNYRFGDGDHAEHLPLIYRAMDDAYLAKDVTLNANVAQYNPRLYFSQSMAFLGRFIPLPLLFLVGTCLANFIIALLNWRIVGHLFRRYEGDMRTLQIWATTAVLAMPVPLLGSVDTLSVDYFIPSFLALPFCMWAFEGVLRQRFWQAGVGFGLASLLHPLVGPELGAIAFGWGLMERLLHRKDGLSIPIGYSKGFLIWAVLTALVIAPFFIGQKGSLSDEEFLRLYGALRHPHHIIPSFFLKLDGPLQAAGWLLCLGFGLNRWLNKVSWKDSYEARTLVGWTASLAVLALMGYVFVEKYPIKLIVLAQTFRLLWVAKWFVVLLFARHCADWFGRYPVLGVLGLFASFHYATLGGFFIGVTILESTKQIDRLKNPRISQLLFALVVIVSVVLWAKIEAIWSVHQANMMLWLFAIGLASICLYLPRQKAKILFISLLGLQQFFWWTTPRREVERPWLKAAAHEYRLNDHQEPWAQAARFAKANTPDSSVFIVPPRTTEWRIYARRALAVDFRTFPYNENLLPEWEQRLYRAYDWADPNGPLKGHELAHWTLLPQYNIQSDSKRVAIAQDLNADYAVIHDSISTQLPVIYRNEALKIIQFNTLNPNQ